MASADDNISLNHRRELRRNGTNAESLLWRVLRRRKLCGLKFRRQFPIVPFIADFACFEKKLVIEVDGGYHDAIYDKDMIRQDLISDQGWKVLRFTNDDVINDVEAVVIAIAKQLGMAEIYLKENSNNA